jgi:hypothetical protein
VVVLDKMVEKGISADIARGLVSRLVLHGEGPAWLERWPSRWVRRRVSFGRKPGGSGHDAHDADDADDADDAFSH